MRKICTLAFFFTVIFLLQHFASAQQTSNSFTIEQVLSSPFPSDMVAAPGGERIAWIFDDQGRRNIWVAEGPQFDAKQLTHYTEDDGQEIEDLAFTADGKWVVFVRGGSKNQAGEYPNPTSDVAGATQAVYAAAWRDGKVKKLDDGNSPKVAPTDDRVVYSKGNQLWIASINEDQKPRQLFVARGNNSSPAWSHSGSMLAFVSSRGDHSFVGVYDFTKNTITYLSPSVDRDNTPRWSQDDRRVAFIRQPARGSQPQLIFDDAPDPWAIMVADLNGGSAREIWRSRNDANSSLPFMADENILQWAAGDRLVFASEQDNWQRLYSVSAQGGTPVPLTPTGCEFQDASYTPDHRSIIFSSNCGDIDRRHLSRVSVDGASPEAITQGEQIEWRPVVTGDSANLVFFKSDARTPAMPYVMPLAGGASHMLAASTLPANFPSSQLVVPQKVLFKAADGLEIHGQLFLPPNARQGEHLPAIIFMHGGPIRQMLLGWHYLYYYHNAYGMNQYLASRGYAVLSVNYRSGIGYGRNFRMAQGRGARGATEYQDIVAAAQYLRRRGDINPAKIGLWGGSYGGYLTALGLARNSDLFAAGVDLHGVHDWSQIISAARWIDYNNPQAKQTAFQSSPVASVVKWRSPVLLIHGDDDRNVSFSQSVDLAHRLREQNVHFEQLIFPDEVHDFLLHRHWLQAYHAASDFFDSQLRER